MDAEVSSRAVDFVVVGGGPAGCAFAVLAARAGASVVLVERDDYQRRRPGEHLAGRVRPILDALGVRKEQASGVAILSPGIVSTWTGDSSLVKLYGATGQAVGLCVVRHRFDELLCRTARAAGAVVLLGRPMRVERLPTRDWRVTIVKRHGQHDEVLARSIVDATGRSASIVGQQGGRRINHGDLVAIVRWLDVHDPPPRAGALLTIEACAHGWWSTSFVHDRTLVVTLYTSLSMIRAVHATPEAWWTQAIGASEGIRRIARECRASHGSTRLYRACPSRSSQVVGDGWIAIGDAAVAFDPLAGQGVALALETACRAFEASCVDPSFVLLGREYRDALLSRFHTHLEGRTHVYNDASAILSPSFVNSAVTARADVR